MHVGDYAAASIAVVTILGGMVATLRFMIVHYLQELRPNSGSTIKDAVQRLEERVDELFKLMVENYDNRRK